MEGNEQLEPDSTNGVKVEKEDNDGNCDGNKVKSGGESNDEVEHKIYATIASFLFL